MTSNHIERPAQKIKNIMYKVFNLHDKESDLDEILENVCCILSNVIYKLNGLNKEKFLNNIKKDNIKEKLKNLTSEAFEKDIFGAPTFVVNNKIFWGQDRLDYALDEYNS